MLNRDYKEMLQCLKEEEAEFIVVGAYALAAHGFPRSTADFDIWINPAAENSVKVLRALAKFGAPLSGLSSADFTGEGMIFQIGVKPCRIDIITGISGNIGFREAFSRAINIQFDEIEMSVLSLNTKY